MYADADPVLPWYLRVLMHSLRVGRLFGVQVRVYTLGLVLVPLILFPLGFVTGLPAGTRIGYVVGATAWFYATIWLHEMGHIWAGRRYHIPTALITISPLGGLAHMSAPAPSPRAEILIALAGPATHLLQLAVLWPLTRVVPWTVEAGPMVLHTACWLNVTLLLFNLLPSFPMDGGRVLRGLLAMRMHPNRATLWAANVGLVGAGGMIVWAIVDPAGPGGLGSGLRIAIAITNILACLRERLQARYADGPYGEARQAWEQDPDAWKSGGETWKEPVEPARARRDAEARPDPAELDRLLDRVREVGLPGLTERERTALQRLSAARRGRR